jgi:penicillin-binding protein 2
LEQAEGAAAVVVDMTGGVLAMASYPTFDPATYSYGDVDPSLAPFLNRAINGLYPPGSTFKMVTAVGGLEEEIITPTTQIRDTGKYTYYAPSYTPGCWIYNQRGTTHGLENVSDAIRDSCNVFFYDVGRRLGIDKLNEYARKFGLGESTGIELSEKTGVVAGRDYTENTLGQVWYEGSTLAAAIGQENNQFTPLQLANYIATLVNGGNHYSAHLLKSVKSSDFSQIIYEYEPQLLDTIDIDPANLAAVKLGMLEVTQSASMSRYFQNLGFQVGAKTGSAQVSSATNSNAVFVAFAPYDDPQIALCIVVEKGGSGSELAATAADIISFYFSSEASLEAGQGENTLIR